MARQGFDLQLTRYDERGWRVTFYTTGMEHSPTSATGTAWERTPEHRPHNATDARRRLGSDQTQGPSVSTGVSRATSGDFLIPVAARHCTLVPVAW
jgi:hypothetical protein